MTTAPRAPRTGAHHRHRRVPPPRSGRAARESSTVSSQSRDPAPRPRRVRGLTAVLTAIGLGALLALTGTTMAGLTGPTVIPAGPRIAAAPPAAGFLAPLDLRAATAALPAGGPYTAAGHGSWHVIPLAGPSTAAPARGQGRDHRVVTYTVEAEDGLDPGSYAGDATFAGTVDTILADPRGWTSRKNITLRRIDTGIPDFRISLTSPMTTRSRALCGFDIRYEGSCFNPAAGRVVINLARWARGALAYHGDLVAYRAYAIGHEVGHALGENHQPCPAPGAPAPVMMQQTYGTNNNYVHQLDQADPAGQDAVPANDDTCRPNPWPALSPRP